ncbi:MAG: IclR family transcriptional regulator [Gemmobacter sp.]|nr:IclR family transcriptional regulator [Gemmobacter sp.]
MRPLSTVLRTLSVLDHIALSRRALKLGDIAQGLGLSRPTAYQRLLTLVEAGLLEQDNEGRYRVSMYATRLAGAALEQAGIGLRSEPVLTRLVATTGETASLAVLDRGQPCIVARAESDFLLRAEQKIGTAMSLEGSASGRVLVAFADDATMERLLRGRHELPQAADINRTRADGYALSSGYTMTGVKAVAAPVFGMHGRCLATVSLVAPDSRFDLERLLEPLLEAARDLTLTLQGGR